MNKQKLDEIASRIDAHLTRFEKDPKINKLDPTYQTRPFYGAHAFRSGSYVRVLYVSYQGSRPITRSEAEAYLAWLDAGNVGRHWEALGTAI